MPAPKKKKVTKRAAKKPPAEPIRDHGDVVTAPAGTSEKAVIDRLTGADKVPSLGELSRAKAPPFDPHAGREMLPGREFGGEPEAMISTIVLMGVDRGGDFEDRIQQLVRYAEDQGMGLYYVTATVGHLDLQNHAGVIEYITDDIEPDVDDDDEPEDKPEADEDLGEPI